MLHNFWFLAFWVTDFSEFSFFRHISYVIEEGVRPLRRGKGWCARIKSFFSFGWVYKTRFDLVVLPLRVATAICCGQCGEDAVIDTRMRVSPEQWLVEWCAPGGKRKAGGSPWLTLMKESVQMGIGRYDTSRALRLQVTHACVWDTTGVQSKWQANHTARGTGNPGLDRIVQERESGRGGSFPSEDETLGFTQFCQVSDHWTLPAPVHCKKFRMI